MIIAKLIFCSIAVVSGVYSIIKYKQGRLRLSQFLMWFLGSVFFFFIVAFIEVSTKAANLIGIQRGVDLLNYLAFIFIFFLIFKLFIKIDNLRSEITKIVTYLAINTPEKKHK
ncbi:DUF2304 family protein [Thermoproteota archaeon]